MFEENENYLFNNDNINSENKIFEFNVNDNALLIENEKKAKNNFICFESTKNRKENYFKIEKNRNIKNIMKEKKERIKKLIGEKTIGDKNYFISDEKIYKTSNKLTKEEKIEIRKIKNRISAQKSRNQQKQLIIDLKIENNKSKEIIYKLEKELKIKNNIINKLISIINNCSDCKNILSNDNIINDNNSKNSLIQDNKNYKKQSSFSSKFIISSFRLFFLLFGIICLFFIYEGKKIYKTRNLFDKNFTDYNNNTYDKQINNSLTYFPNYNSNALISRNNKDYVIIKDNTIHEKRCEDYLNAKITKDLDFENLFENNNKKCFDFRMIIPCKSHNVNNSETSPIIALKNSNYYNQIIHNIGEQAFYEINCRINSVNKYKNSKCKNNFLN